ncbi:MAG: hypothetical protein ABI317_11045 [Gaiellales bacterium]
MRGILIVVERDWLELVERESRASFVLGRLDRSQPAWTQAGDPWLLATGEPPLVVASSRFVEHELLTVDEAFDRYGYGTGALTVDHALAQLWRGQDAGSAAPDELYGWVALADLESVGRPHGARELEALGIQPGPAGEPLRLDDAQVAALLGH